MKQAFILDGRLHEIKEYEYSIRAKTQDSWGKLFKTEQHKRLVAHADKVHQHWAVMAGKKFPNDMGKKVRFTMLGSDRLIDVSMRRNQKYLMEFID